MRRPRVSAAIACFACWFAPAVNAAQPVYRLDHGAVPKPPERPFAPTDKLQYYGGRVLSNVNIVEVSWNSAVDATYASNLAGFYKAIVKSSFVDWMTEYDTIGKTGYADMLPGSNQHIGRGTFGGSYVITPGNVSTSLTDGDISTELVAQLKAGKLPAPTVDAGGNVDSLYMIDFPAGYTITLFGSQSCASFGAYHFTVKYSGMSVPYGVHPNCGFSFATSTLIHSHELAEAMADMEVGLANQNAPTARPVSWVTVAATALQSLEAGDVCEGTSDTIAGYQVQQIWSNFAQGCVAQIPICDGSTQPPACRPCNKFDSGNACSTPKPACATAGPDVGRCVTCTSAYHVQCTGKTPVCDDATYTCVGCLKSSDCPATDPVCNLASKTCRGCQNNGECAKGVCDLSPDAEHGQCVACNVDADCPPDKQCTGHACVPRPQPDAGTPAAVDAGAGGGPGDAASPDSGSSGCACRTEPKPSPYGALVLALAALLLIRRSRR